ncbi:MAG: hypothetical protein JOY69_07915 [Candidatus Eremiobacteraeota bacterium]|nr:hypothetical protein [Candidatus Eremiobacteraeota bacterium]
MARRPEAAKADLQKTLIRLRQNDTLFQRSCCGGVSIMNRCAGLGLSTGGVAAILMATGCTAAGSSTPVAIQSASVQAQRLQTRSGGTWAKSVFVSDHFLNKVYQFADSKNGAVIGTITDSKSPSGLDMDAKGNLYVAAEGDYGIKIYAPNTYTAMATLNDPNEFITAVAACPNGTVYATNEFNTSQGAGNVVIYAPGAKNPTGTVPDSNIYSAQFASCDKNNVLWFTYLNAAHTMQVASYDGATVKEYGNLGLGGADSASGIQAMSNGYLAIGNTAVGINRYNDPPNKQTTRALGCRVGNAITFAFAGSDRAIFEVDSSKSVEKCDRNGAELYTIGQGILETAFYVYAFPAGNN